MAYELWQQSYGKSAVRVTKVQRDSDVHEITELSVDVELDGDFNSAYTKADNSLVLPTDTIKNTIYAFARELDPSDLESFAWTLGSHFVEEFAHISTAVVRVKEQPLQRVKTPDGEHPHTFLGTSTERNLCQAYVTRSEDDNQPEGSFESGIEGLALLKTTASGFSNFLRDDLTTLADADDRILSTTLRASWNYNELPDNCRDARNAIRETLIAEFAAEFSPSVQATLFAMGRAVLESQPIVEDISLEMPNQHRLLVDLEALGRDNPNVLFMAIDEPYGVINAVITRGDGADDASEEKS